ncbi:MAG: response regulator [Desulfobacterales bacterium]|nr:response regulator [Desulfobacterales bacterium]
MAPYDTEDSDQIHILVADDEAPIRDMLQKAIESSGYECSVAEDGIDALRVMKERRIHILVSDIRMPDMDGIELLDEVKKCYDTDVIMMTGYSGDYSYEEAIKRGASDFAFKPLSPKELIVRIKRVLRERRLITEHSQTHQELKSVYDELHLAYLDTVNRLILAAEYKDDDTGDHIARMSRYSELVALTLGLPERDVLQIRYSSPMHDVGKIGIPDSILLKPGKLTNEEFDVMKTHTILGANIFAKSTAEILQNAHDIALTHHEKWNGKGYPQGLAGDKIPILGRIVGIVDVFDALTSTRPYKKPYPVEVAIDIIKKERGEHFDPAVTDAFLSCIDGIIEIKADVGTAEDSILSSFVWSERDQVNMAALKS